VWGWERACNWRERKREREREKERERGMEFGREAASEREGGRERETLPKRQGVRGANGSRRVCYAAAYVASKSYTTWYALGIVDR